MACLWCQQQFNEHTKEELVVCITWLQDKFHIICENHRKNKITENDKGES